MLLLALTHGLIVALGEVDALGIPTFKPQLCAQAQCHRVIQGSMFVSTTDDLPAVVCEDCYHSRYYGNPSLVKKYKHCVLEAITPELSREICRCKDVPRYTPEETWAPKSLFPRDGGWPYHGNDCGLLELSERVTLAKYNALVQSVVGTRDPAKATALSSKLEALEEPQVPKWSKKEARARWAEPPGPETRAAHRVATDPAADTDMPLFLRNSAAKHPFADVHMALRVGPLVIENGVSQ